MKYFALILFCIQNLVLHAEVSNHPIDAPPHVTYISHAGTTIGLLPDLGGRIVIWKVEGVDTNLLDEDPAEWNRKPTDWPTPQPDMRWPVGLGHIVWIGPQDTWWSDREKAPANTSYNWPPDPTLTIAPYRVVEQSGKAIVLQSRPSTFTHIQLQKTLSISDTGSVQLHVKATNVGQETVSRNLWFNFRAPHTAQELVYMPTQASVQIKGKGQSQWTGNFHSLQLLDTTDIKQEAKAFINEARGSILFTTSNGIATIAFEPTPSEHVPNGHGAIEIFRAFNRKSGKGLLELEHHGALHHLAPGQSMEHSVAWSFEPTNHAINHAHALATDWHQ